MKELADKIVREYNEEHPDFYKIAEWGKELADIVLAQKANELKPRPFEVG